MIVRRFLLSVAAAGFLAACAEETAEAPALPAVAGAWVIDKAASRIEFSGTQTGKAFTGEFERFDAVIVFDPADPASAKIEAIVETGSAKSGDRQRDAALPGAEWFSTKAFPEAKFVSDAVAAAAGGYEARGKLTIREAAQDVTLPFTVLIEGERAVADAALTLNRADFGVGQGEEFLTDKWVGYDVKVSIHIEAVR